MRISNKAKNVIRHIVLIAVCFVLIYPVVFMFFASFKESNEVFTSLSLFPEKYRWENYVNGWQAGASGSITFTNYFLNTFALVIPVVFFTIVSCSLVAYGFARFNFPFRKILRFFDDPYFIEAYDYLHSTAEDRYIDIGSLGGIVEIVVVFAFRGHRTRLISARTATQKEKNLYNEHLKETI